MGPAVSRSQLETDLHHIAVGLEEGARLRRGGHRLSGEGLAGGYFVEPTLFDDVTVDMKLNTEEVFGPVLPIVTFKEENEAIELANDTKYGLGASVWTKDEKTAEFFVHGIESGTVFVNAMVKSDPRLPIGGTKASGYGRELSSYGIKEFVNTKAVWVE